MTRWDGYGATRARGREKKMFELIGVGIRD